MKNPLGAVSKGISAILLSARMVPAMVGAVMGMMTVTRLSEGGLIPTIGGSGHLHAADGADGLIV